MRHYNNNAKRDAKTGDRQKDTQTFKLQNKLRTTDTSTNNKGRYKAREPIINDQQRYVFNKLCLALGYTKQIDNCAMSLIPRRRSKVVVASTHRRHRSQV